MGWFETRATAPWASLLALALALVACSDVSGARPGVLPMPDVAVVLRDAAAGEDASIVDAPVMDAAVVDAADGGADAAIAHEEAGVDGSTADVDDRSDSFDQADRAPPADAPLLLRACGESGELCCSTVPTLACRQPLLCLAGRCDAMPADCGRVGQGCCAGGACTLGLGCVGGTCREGCGEGGQGCCAGIECRPGLVCMARVCVPVDTPCGGRGQMCCYGAGGPPACAINLGCDRLTDTCESCGTVGGICCGLDTPNRCVGEAVCDSVRCVARAPTCGAQGQPCCGGACLTGLACNASGVCTPVPSCGFRGTPCCTEAGVRSCYQGVCVAGVCSMPPPPCGRLGQPCCAGQCVGAYGCVSGTCRVLDPTCGAPAQACCEADAMGRRAPCQALHYCSAGVCVPYPLTMRCGLIEGQACCEGSCVDGLACVSDVCRIVR